MLVLFDQGTPVTQEALTKKRRRGAALQKGRRQYAMWSAAA